MQLICNNTVLDLYDDASLQFKHTNPLFAFDKMTCERTTQFKLPCTPTNDRVLSLARIPAYAGAGMRRRFGAQLQAGTLVRDGYLYVSDFDGKDYTAIFVTGELLGLQQIRDAGKIKDFWQPSGSIIWSNDNIKDANTYEGQQSLALTRYKTNDMPCHPSFDLSDVMDAAYYALTGSHITTRWRGFRLIPKEITAIPKTDINITYAGTGASPSPTEFPTDDANAITVNTNVIDTSYTQVLLFYDRFNNDANRFWLLRQFVAKQTLLLTFPNDFPSNYFLMSITPRDVDPEFNVLSPYWFLGGYSFTCNLLTNTIDTDGTPLAGRTIEVPSGTPFILMSSNWVTFRPHGMQTTGIVYGFESISATNKQYNYNLTIEGKSVAPGDTIRAVDLLPDLTLVELMKIQAYCAGRALMYDETNGVTFDDLNFASWSVADFSDKIIKRGEVARTFGEYAQNNYIRFKSGNDVPANQRITAVYTVDNDNIEEAKDIANIPYSEGSIDADGGYIVARFDAEDAANHKLYENGIMYCGTATCGLRISLPKNAGLQALCDASTQIQISARLTLYEYNQITPKTLIQVDGTRYVWTERVWQKDTAQFTLAKIA